MHPVGLVAVCNITWQWSDFIAVADTFQHWAPNAPDNLSTFLRFAVGSAPGAGTITLFGQLTPDSPAELAGFSALLAPILGAAPPTGVNVQMMPYSAAAAIFAGADPKNPQWMLHPHNDRQLFKSTSAVAYEPFPLAALNLLKSQLESAPAQQDRDTNEPSMVQLLAGGGAPGRVAVDGTAVPHRKAVCVVQYDAYWTDPADQTVAENWIEGVRTAMLPFAKNAYVNYVDSRIEDYLDAYYVTNLPRLLEVKRAVDPQNVLVPAKHPGDRHALNLAAVFNPRTRWPTQFPRRSRCGSRPSSPRSSWARFSDGLRASRRSRLRDVVAIPGLLARSIPVAILGPALLIFAMFFAPRGFVGITPDESFDLPDRIRHAVAPVLCLAVPFGAWASVIFADFFESRGITSRTSLRSIVIPAATVASAIGPALLAAELMIEPGFAWPGLARLLSYAITDYDPTTVAGILLTVLAAFAVLQLIGAVARETPPPSHRRSSALSVLGIVALIILGGAVVAAAAANVIAPAGPNVIDEVHFQGYPLPPGAGGHLSAPTKTGAICWPGCSSACAPRSRSPAWRRSSPSRSDWPPQRLPSRSDGWVDTAPPPPASPHSPRSRSCTFSSWFSTVGTVSRRC